MKILLLFLSVSFFSFAQEAVKIKVDTEEVTIKPSEQKKKAVVKDKTHDLNNLTTRESRALTKFQVTAGVGAEIGGGSGHLSFAYQLSRDLFLHSRAAFPLGVDSDNDDFFFAELGLKIFTGNSFFITPSLFYTKGEDLQDEDFFGINQPLPGDASGAGLMFTIGNEWRINQNLVIGADWLGLGYHLTEFDKEVQAGIARFLVFNIGYAF